VIRSYADDERRVLAYIRHIGPLHLKDPVLPDLLKKQLVQSQITRRSRVTFDLNARARRLMGYRTKPSSPRHLERRFGFRRLLEEWHQTHRLTRLDSKLPMYGAGSQRYWLVYWASPPRSETLRATQQRAQAQGAVLVASWPEAEGLEREGLAIVPEAALSLYPPLSLELIAG